MGKFIIFSTIGIGIGICIVFAVMMIGTKKVSLNFEPDENSEESFVGSNLEKEIAVLGENEVQEKGEIAEQAKTAKSSSSSTPVATAPTPAPAPPSAPPPLSNGTCPVSTLSCVPCRISDGHWACRVEAGKEDGYLGWSCQNNNPGNIRPSSFRETIIRNNGGPLPCGKRVDPIRGEYMIFSTYTDGRNAMKAYINGINNGQHSSYAGCGNCSLRFFLGKWSTNTTTYPDGIGAKIGVNPDSVTLSWVIGNKFDALIDAMQAQEGFFVQ